jgi:hypothetical protein
MALALPCQNTARAGLENLGILAAHFLLHFNVISDQSIR